MSQPREIKAHSIAVSLKLGFFLARRQIGRGNLWTTLLIVFVMTLTFLNLVFIGGILVGLIEGSVYANRQFYTGDIIISARAEKQYIEDSPTIESVAASLPWTKYLTARYVGSAVIEAGYKERTNYTDIANETSGLIAGIDPTDEANVTKLHEKIIEGRYLEEGDADGILIGADKLAQYLPIETPGFRTLRDVNIGDKVRIRVGENVKEFTVRGFVRAKVNEVDSRLFVLDTTLRELLGRRDKSVNEISIALHNPEEAGFAKEALLKSGVGERARVQSWQDAQPKFIKDIQDTFAMLGNIVGSIGLVVASITIFIVVFINAITRRKFIGILRGIGVNALAIEVSYVLQALFYAVVGTILGAAILYAFIQPWIAANPINFPFSDGILVAPLSGTSLRAFLLLLASLIAGYVPAKMIIRQNPLDAILGR